jgi:RHS repeat-associated protein
MATDAYGNPNWREDYLAFGEKTRGEASVNANQNWFIGKPQDATTGLVYFGARWYDPSVPRFLSFDPAPVDEANPHSFNRYAYGNNNPNKFLDPDGRNPLLIAMAVGAVAGGTISGTINGVSQYVNTGSVQFGGANGVFAAASEGAMIGAVFGMAGGAAVGAGAATVGSVRAESTTRVGRWMSEAEHTAMVKSNTVQESFSGTTHVASPASAATYGKQAPKDSVYVEFNVPTSSLKATSTGVSKIIGPNSLQGRAAVRRGEPAPQMPRATEIATPKPSLE